MNTQHIATLLGYVAIVTSFVTVALPDKPEPAQAAPTAQEQPAEEAPEPPSTEPVEPAKFTATPTEGKSQKDLNKEYLIVFGTAAFGEAEIPALLTLVQKESGFRNDAQNPRSTAYGMFQFLDKTWGNYGYAKTSDPLVQIEAGLKYIKARYGTPSKALNFHKANNWY
jgi:hypothetical protein